MTNNLSVYPITRCNIHNLYGIKITNIQFIKSISSVYITGMNSNKYIIHEVLNPGLSFSDKFLGQQVKRISTVNNHYILYNSVENSDGVILIPLNKKTKADIVNKNSSNTIGIFECSAMITLFDICQADVGVEISGGEYYEFVGRLFSALLYHKHAHPEIQYQHLYSYKNLSNGISQWLKTLVRWNSSKLSIVEEISNEITGCSC
jgi:hypothetical protein